MGSRAGVNPVPTDGAKKKTVRADSLLRLRVLPAGCCRRARPRLAARRSALAPSRSRAAAVRARSDRSHLAEMIVVPAAIALATGACEHRAPATSISKATARVTRRVHPCCRCSGKRITSRTDRWSGQQHDEPVDADADSGGRRHAVFERAHEVPIGFRNLFVARRCVRRLALRSAPADRRDR